MITDVQALSIAKTQIDPELTPSSRREDGIELAILEERTMRRPWGWLFTYNSRKFAETGDQNFALWGCQLIAVLKQDGSVHKIGVQRQALKDFEMEFFGTKERKSKKPRPT